MVNYADCYFMDILSTTNKLMQDQGLTRKVLAEKLGIPPSTVYNWWNRGSRPTVNDAYAIAKFFGVTVEYLMLGVDPDKKQMSPRMREISEEIEILDDQSFGTVRATISQLAELCRMKRAQGFEESEEVSG